MPCSQRSTEHLTSSPVNHNCANETPFSKDSYFGYSHADLKKWVKEKTEERVQAKNILSVSIDDIRKGRADSPPGNCLLQMI